MEKVRPWCGQPSDRGRLKHRTETITAGIRGDSLLNDTRCYFNVRSKTDTSQLNLPAWMDNVNMACNALCEPYARPELNVVHVLATIPIDRRKKLLFLTDTI